MQSGNHLPVPTSLKSENQNTQIIEYMAGFVNVWDASGSEGSINIGSSNLDGVVRFLKYCKSASPILAADNDFNPDSDFVIYDCIRYITLACYSNITLTEIERLFVEAVNPTYSYWSDNSTVFDDYYFESWRRHGVDADAMCIELKARYQQVFRNVADLMQQRPERK